MAYNAQQRRQMRRQCTVVVPGFRSLPPAEEFKALASWCEARQIESDMYGEGGLLGTFEQQIADLLGKPAAVFMPSGVMAQLIAVRLHTEAARLPRFGMSPNAHLAVHEQQAFESLWGLHGVPIGSALRPMLASDLAAVHQPLACAIVELPMREAGGQLPTWEQLEALKAQAAASGTPLHLDGARLWPCRSFYAQRSYADIVTGFQSVYVSMYKDIGGQAGALLAGEPAFIANARLWQRRMGGNLVQQTSFVASAAMRFEQRLEILDACCGRARELALGLGGLNGVRINPATPHTNMLHLHVDAPAEALNEARDALAEAERCWLFGAARPSEVPGWSCIELNVGDQLLALDNATVLPLFERVLDRAREAHVLN
ncbi:MAG: threonine aldolase [Burkholderiaceae bacterium]|nr:threonine aldolase [Burkholderiaceae bacterium]